MGAPSAVATPVQSSRRTLGDDLDQSSARRDTVSAVRCTTGATLPEPSLEPSDAIVNALMVLTLDDLFVGNCIAVTGQVVLTAGHHFNANKDDPSRFAVVSRAGNVYKAEFALKHSKLDVAIFWVSAQARLPHVNLRGYRPPVESRVATVWLNRVPPHHDLIVTPATVISSEIGLCQAKGSVTTGGTSGAPVIDSRGELLVGIHLSSNKRDGSRVSEFICSRDVLSALAEHNISLRREAVTYPKAAEK